MIDQQTGVMELLKESTSELHKEAEAHPFQQAMIRGRLTYESYAGYLSQMLAVHGALESALRRNSALPAVQAVVRPHHFREHLLLEDLAGFRVEPEPALPATQVFIESMLLRISGEPVSILGFLYVLEGSTNGSKFIARSVQRALGLEGNRGTKYLNPHADRQTERWAGFKAEMARLEWNDADRGSLVCAATEMFLGIIRVSDELMMTAYDAAA
jgi:heme oxygenase